jgi:hypothetical protein
MADKEQPRCARSRRGSEVARRHNRAGGGRQFRTHTRFVLVCPPSRGRIGLRLRPLSATTTSSSTAMPSFNPRKFFKSKRSKRDKGATPESFPSTSNRPSMSLLPRPASAPIDNGVCCLTGKGHRSLLCQHPSSRRIIYPRRPLCPSYPFPHHRK